MKKLLWISLLILSMGCELGNKKDSNAYVENADPNAKFAIAAPLSGARLDSGVGGISGVGLRDVKAFSVSVKTDGWYEQFGQLSLGDNNTWFYAPVYCEGTGSFNNHTIRAELQHTDGSVEVSEVSGIIRK